MACFPTIGNRILRFDELDSTNSFLLREKQYLEQHGLVVVAQSQVKGRGRGGRSYVALPEKNITFSVVIHPLPHMEEMGFYALLAGIAVVRSLKIHTRKAPRLKWPNDILVENRKICGILLEAVPLSELERPVLVMGIGINCLGLTKDFPEELQNKLTTLQEESDHALDRESVFQEILSHIEHVLQELATQGSEPLLKEWQAHSNSLGAKIQYETKDGWNKGTIAGLTPAGYLLIRTESGELHTHVSGDILYSESPYHSAKACYR